MNYLLALFTFCLGLGIYAHATCANPFGYGDISIAIWWGVAFSEVLPRRGYL